MEVNSIYNIECITGMQKIETESIDMIFCDLPYGKTKNTWDKIISPNKLWEQYNRIIKRNGAIVLFGQDKFTARMMLSNPKLHRYNLIWDKMLSSGFLNANIMPLREHEDIMIFYKKTPTYNPQFTHGKPLHSIGNSKKNENSNYGCIKTKNNLRAGTTQKHPTSILRFQKVHPSVSIHPTQKPLNLCRYLIRMFTNKDDLVLDNCCGSGSIPLAALMEQRKYIGMDNGICLLKNKYHMLS